MDSKTLEDRLAVYTRAWERVSVDNLWKSEFMTIVLLELEIERLENLLNKE